jgi:hypothetical protein
MNATRSSGPQPVQQGTCVAGRAPRTRASSIPTSRKDRITDTSDHRLGLVIELRPIAIAIAIAIASMERRMRMSSDHHTMDGPVFRCRVSLQPADRPAWRLAALRRASAERRPRSSRPDRRTWQSRRPTAWQEIAQEIDRSQRRGLRARAIAGNVR